MPLDCKGTPENRSTQSWCFIRPRPKSAYQRKISVCVSHHIFIWVHMFWHLTYVCSDTLSRHWHQPCSDTLPRHCNQLRWSWRGGAHAAAVTEDTKISVSTLFLFDIRIISSYLEFPFREKGLGNSRNTREFQGIQGNPRESRESTAVAGSWK